MWACTPLRLINVILGWFRDFYHYCRRDVQVGLCRVKELRQLEIGPSGTRLQRGPAFYFAQRIESIHRLGPQCD